MLTNKGGKRLLVSCLVLCIIALQFQVVFASTAAGLSNKSYESDMKVLDKLGITGFSQVVNKSKVDVNGEQKNMFTVQSGDIINDITVLQNSADTVVLKIDQDADGITNVLEFRSNGDIILDGNLVEITYDVDMKSSFDTPVISPKAGATIYWRDKVPYGSASDYSHFLKNENVADIALKKTISKIGFAALLSILGGAVAGSLTAAVSSFAPAAGELIYDYFLDNAGTTSNLSCKSKVYTHKNYTSGYIGYISSFVYKYNTTFYSKKNYAGVSKTCTAYKVNMQG